VLLKALPHVKHRWGIYWEKNSIEESRIFGAKPTWDFFMDAVKEKYYLVGNYDDLYMRWTMLHQKRDQTMLEFTDTFDTLCTKLGIKEFLDISSLGAAYRYVVKIKQKFKHQNKREFGSTNPQQPKHGKDIPNPQNTQPQENQSKP
jgi:hypothetical protein